MNIINFLLYCVAFVILLALFIRIATIIMFKKLIKYIEHVKEQMIATCQKKSKELESKNEQS